MQKRYLYVLLFGIPGFFVAGVAAVVALGAGAGVLWLFVLGDNPWPAAVDTSLAILFGLTFLLVWCLCLAAGFVAGRRLEADPTWNWSHILLSGGLTLLMIVMIIFQQFRMGNLGPRSDTVLCSEYCSLRGYPGSGMPPENSGDRTCSCYDAAGNEALKIPLGEVAPGSSK